MNDENLKPGEYKLSQEEAKKGGTNSGKSRRRKADMRKAVQEILDGIYTDKKTGVSKSGVEVIALNLFKMASDPNNKQSIAATKLILELTGQDKTPDDKKKAKAEIKLLEARIAAIMSDDGKHAGELPQLWKALGVEDDPE